MLNDDQKHYLSVLREGKYPQTQHALVRTSHHLTEACCLAVAALEFGGEIRSLGADKCGVFIEEESYNDDTYIASGSMLPPSINDRLNLTINDNQDMAVMNDTHGFSFDEIADTLEGYWNSAYSDLYEFNRELELYAFIVGT